MDGNTAVALGETFPDREVRDVTPAGPSWNPRNRTVQVAFADESAEELADWVDAEVTSSPPFTAGRPP